MRNDKVRLIKEKMLEGRIMESLRNIALRHRIQASPGYRAAAEWCRDILLKYGVSCEIHRYPAKKDVQYFHSRMFREWACAGARLELVEPEAEVLCDYEDDNMSVPVRSSAARFDSLDLVQIPTGSSEADFEDIDLTGKVILVEGDTTEFAEWAALKKGAVGVVTDRIQEIQGVRTKADVFDVRGYNAFSEKSADEYGLFGFSITPRQGKRLRALCRTMKEAHDRDSSKPAYPKVKGFVDCSFYDGAIENVVAEIPGEGDEAVIVTAHLCHPKPCANDNASGCAGSIEIMTVLARLIADGELSRPKRTIRMILMPEMTGSNAYLATLGEEERKKLLAAVNLDMIGARQGRGAGPICIFRPCDASASFTGDLLEHLMEGALEDYSAIFLPDRYVSTHHYSLHPFCSGSDHQIFGDPSIGIPSVSFTQWPDLYYHTSGDTCERIDPSLIKTTAAIAGGYLWALANLEVEDLPFAMMRLQQGFAARLRETAKKHSGDSDMLRRQVRYHLEVACNSAEDVKRFFPADDLSALLAREKELLRMQADTLLGRFGLEAAIPLPNTGPVPRRRFYAAPDYAKINETIKAEKHARLRELQPTCGRMAGYLILWMDGRRTVEEIAEKAAMESGCGGLEYAKAYIDMLCDAKLVEY